MLIQSLSIAVPAKCINSCKFCVAQMHGEVYVNQIEENKRFTDLYIKDYKKRLLFARDNGCNTVMITGNGEPLMNRNFLKEFMYMNEDLPNPFRWIELQTSGTLLDDEYLRFLRNTVGVNTISLSLSDVFSSEKNAEYNGTKKGFEVDIDSLCAEIKKYDFNLRLSLNMTDSYNDVSPQDIFDRCSQLGADQITFRKFYTSGKNTPQDLWIEQHSYLGYRFYELVHYIRKNGKALEILPFGAIKYSIDKFGVVIDDDCMSTELKDTMKYLVLRPDCKLYSKWDDKNSLVF